MVPSLQRRQLQNQASQPPADLYHHAVDQRRIVDLPVDSSILLLPLARYSTLLRASHSAPAATPLLLRHMSIINGSLNRRLEMDSTVERMDEPDTSNPRDVEDATGSRAVNPKNSRRRTKSGCLTCRRRRIKCGEERPVCANCTKSKRHCEGYNIKVVFKDPVIRGPLSHISGHTGTLPRSATHNHPDTATSSRSQLPPILPNLQRRVQDDEQQPFNQQGGLQYNPQLSAWGQTQHVQQDYSYQTIQGQPSLFNAQTYQFHQNPAQFSHPSQQTSYPPEAQSSTSWGPTGEREVFSYAEQPARTSFDGRVPNRSGDAMRSVQILHDLQSQHFTQPSIQSMQYSPNEEEDSDGGPYDVESDEDQIMADINDGVDPLARVMERNAADGRSLQMVMRAQAAQEGQDTRKRTVHSVIENYGPGMLATYWPSAKDSPLSDPVAASIFSHFLNVVAPGISMHERHPANTEKLFAGHQVPKSQQHLWAYTMPTIALRSHALMHAMLAMSSLHIARLQNTSIMASLKHYHLAIRKLAKDVGSTTRRKQLATLATTLLLGYYEVMSGDHSKWCDHLLGSHQLLKQIDFAGMTKHLWRKRRDSRIANDSTAMVQHPNDSLSTQDDIDEKLVSELMGKTIRYAEFGEVSEDLDPRKPKRKSYTDQELSMYETQRDLFWWFLKQDSLQSLLSQNKTFLSYDRWSHCPPRARIGRRDAVYGTFDHLILLLGRLADFASKDLKRKRKTFRMPGAPPGKNSKQQGQQGNASGGPPPGWTGPPPSGFGPPQQHPDSKNENTPPETSGNASPGWKSGPPRGFVQPQQMFGVRGEITPPYEVPSGGPPPGWTGPPPPGWVGPPPQGWQGPPPNFQGPRASSQQQSQVPSSDRSDQQNLTNSFGMAGGPPPGWTGPPPSGWQGPPPLQPPLQQQHLGSSNNRGEPQPAFAMSAGPPPGWTGPPPQGWQGPSPISQQEQRPPTEKYNSSQRGAVAAMGAGPPPGWSGPPPPGWSGPPPAGWQGPSAAPQSGPAAGSSAQKQGPHAFPQLPPFAGLLPTGESALPRGFSPEASSPASGEEENDTELDELTRKAEVEWQEIKEAFEKFRTRLGADFQPLDEDSGLQHIDSPFGPAIQYRTYTIANIWLMYQVGLIILQRSRPPMPPSAMVAAGFAAHLTAINAITIGRIAAGIAPDARTATQVSITAGSGLNDSAFPIFVAAVQIQDAAQRQWIIQRMLDIERLTGWETASQVAKGCETSWMRAAEVGRGPPYERYVEPMPVNKIWDRAGQRMERIFASAGDTTHVSSRDTVVTGRVQFAAGVIGIEIGLERIALESDDEEDEDRR